MSFFPSSLENLIDAFASLPGIGKKSAQRLAFYLLARPDEEAKAFADAIVEAKNSVHCCRICQNLTDGEVCSICRSCWKRIFTMAALGAKYIFFITVKN